MLQLLSVIDIVSWAFASCFVSCLLCYFEVVHRSSQLTVLHLTLRALQTRRKSDAYLVYKKGHLGQACSGKALHSE